MIGILGRQIFLTLINLVLEKPAKLDIDTACTTCATIRTARTRARQCFTIVLLAIDPTSAAIVVVNRIANVAATAASINTALSAHTVH